MILDKKDLLLSPEAFSQLACLDGRVFGVKTFCDLCNQGVNSCLRPLLLDALTTSQVRAEQQIGWLLTPRYIEEIVEWSGGTENIQVKFPGIDAVNVKSQETLLGSYTIPFYFATNVVTQTSGGVCFVEVSRTYVKNPTHAVIRDSNTGSVYAHLKHANFPRLNVNNNWEIAIDTNCTVPKTVNIHHCQYAFLTIATPECGGKYVARTLNKEYLTFAEDPVVVGGSTIFTFYVWSLVDPSFQKDSEYVDLTVSPPEFYKLINEVELYCETEVEAPPEVIVESTCGCGGFNSAPKVEIEIVNAERAFLKLCSSQTCTCKKIKVKIYYKVTPDKVSFFAESMLSSASEAIAYLAASELPLETCNCSVNKGFIKLAQQIYAEQRIGFTGDVITNIRYGNRHGQMVYAERIDRLYKFKRLVKV